MVILRDNTTFSILLIRLLFLEFGEFDRIIQRWQSYCSLKVEITLFLLTRWPFLIFCWVCEQMFCIVGRIFFVPSNSAFQFNCPSKKLLFCFFNFDLNVWYSVCTFLGSYSLSVIDDLFFGHPTWQFLLWYGIWSFIAQIRWTCLDNPALT